MWKIQSCEVGEFCMLLYYARKSVTTFRNVVTLFPCVIKSIQNSQNLHDCIFHTLRYFSTKLHNFTKLMMLFPAVLIDFPNSNVCLIGEWSMAFAFDATEIRCINGPLNRYVLRAVSFLCFPNLAYLYRALNFQNTL